MSFRRSSLRRGGGAYAVLTHLTFRILFFFHIYYRCIAIALPTIEQFQNLQTLIAEYPAPEALRSSLLDHLHTRLAEALPRDAAALTLRATRALVLASAGGSAGGALVDGLRRANEEMLAAIDAEAAAEGAGRCTPASEEPAGAYAQFVEEWCGKEDVDEHLVRFFCCCY